MQNFVLFGANGYDWLKAIIAIVVSLAVSKLLRWLVVVLFKRFSKMPGDKAKETVESCIMPLCLLIIVIGIRLAISNFPIQDIRPTISKIYTVLACLSITWFFSKTLTAVISGVITSRNPDGKNSVSMMLPTIMHLVQIIIWGIGIAITLDNTGYDVKALIAGLGFGGVALALAAKNTVTNFLGGATLLVDNPFSIGDRVRVAGYDGFVRFIGLRSFRLTTLDGTEVTIPNANIIDNAIENVTREPSRRIVLSLQLTYGTTTAQMQRAIDVLRDIALNNPHVEDTCHVYFSDFSDYSLTLKFIYYIIKGNDIFETQSEMNMIILSRFNSVGFEFAFPTHSLYVENSGKHHNAIELADNGLQKLENGEAGKIEGKEIKKLEK